MSFSGAGVALKHTAAEGRIAGLIEQAAPARKLRPRGPAAKRRFARVVLRAALKLVEGEFPPGARPDDWEWKDGGKRSTARAIAIHVAREARGVKPLALAQAACMGLSGATNSMVRIWERRDDDLDFDLRVGALVERLREAEL